ncbi:hypothetical protein AJ79_07796 [Helicocarpus griseus UAMH5409]|uniref:OTU domain-containing protein n=1 Tax=Helicocarpus griseus UAMH5409 TaxID=1447875 RepID=A0A2B7WZ22_9EURO|nr:hypothetical protein AJ79_07796 [Helicocarpus griseus UAMH5409]
MANLPPSGTRIVPIMANVKPSPRPASNGAGPVRKRTMKKEHPELKMDCLEESGLYAMPVAGDGNCLYYSLSDQLYGHVHRHREIRKRVVNAMRANMDYFLAFYSHKGEERRNSPRTAKKPSQGHEKDVSADDTQKGQIKAFKRALVEVAKDRTWGDNQQVQAFVLAYGVDVLLYTETGIRKIDIDAITNANLDPDRKVVHIAFHSFRHYNSVRSLDGPHSGLPNLPGGPREDTDAATKEVDLKEENDIMPKLQNIDSNPADMRWMITIRGQRVPVNDEESIRAIIGEYSPNITAALKTLVENSDRPLPSSALPETFHAICNGSRPKLPSTISPSSGVNVGSSSRSSSRHSTASKRSAEDSDVDDEDCILPAIRRSRGRCRKRRMLEDVTVDILGNRDEVFSIEVNNTHRAETTNVTLEASEARSSTRTLSNERSTSSQNVSNDVVESVEVRDNSSRSDRTVSPSATSASQFSDDANSKEDDDDYNDDDADFDDDESEDRD